MVHVFAIIGFVFLVGYVVKKFITDDKVNEKAEQIKKLKEEDALVGLDEQILELDKKLKKRKQKLEDKKG